MFHNVRLKLSCQPTRRPVGKRGGVRCNCKSRLGFFNFTSAFTSARRAESSASFAFTLLYRYVICLRTVSSSLAANSTESSSTNLYSMFCVLVLSRFVSGSEH